MAFSFVADKTQCECMWTRVHDVWECGHAFCGVCMSEPDRVSEII